MDRDRTLSLTARGVCSNHAASDQASPKDTLALTLAAMQ